MHLLGLSSEDIWAFHIHNAQLATVSHGRRLLDTASRSVIALGSDIDCIPQASQKPGVAYPDPIIEGAPGHGEGHNSGMPLLCDGRNPWATND